jgi:hypothetical protein
MIASSVVGAKPRIEAFRQETRDAQTASSRAD